MKITDLCTELPTKTVKIRGQDLTVSAVTMDVEFALEQQQPEPKPPAHMTQTEQAAERKTERFRDRFSVWQAKRRIAICGVSASIQNSEGESWNPTRDAKWVDEWVSELKANLASEEALSIYHAQSSILFESMMPDPERIGDGSTEGNSSGHSDS